MKDLHRRYAKNLYRFGVHMLGDEGLALEEDLTQSQIAERLSLPLGTVKTRTFHGMRALRSVLGERGFSAA